MTRSFPGGPTRPTRQRTKSQPYSLYRTPNPRSTLRFSSIGFPSTRSTCGSVMPRRIFPIPIPGWISMFVVGAAAEGAAATRTATTTSPIRPSWSGIADPARVPEHPELGDVAAEEERGRPVGDDAQLPGEERQLVQVVRPRHEPAEESAEAQAHDVGDALVAAERGDLAEHAVTIRHRCSLQVAREP